MMFSDESAKSGVGQFVLTQSLHIVDFIRGLLFEDLSRRDSAFPVFPIIISSDVCSQYTLS